MNLFVFVRGCRYILSTNCCFQLKVKHGDFEKSEDLLWQAAEGMYDTLKYLKQKLPQSQIQAEERIFFICQSLFSKLLIKMFF